MRLKPAAPRLAAAALGLGFALALPFAATTAQPPAPPKEAPKKMDAPKMPPLADAGWKKQPSGLEIWDVKEGTGDPAVKDAVVRIHYTGWTTDGKEFDSSVTRGKVATFPLTKLIPGWKEGIPGMKPGGTRRLKIPSDLAYGDDGRPPVIPPKATLIFEIEYVGNPLALPDAKAKEWAKQPDGVRLWDVQVGTGAEVKPGATVTIHYTGWTLDGKIFDSSVERGRPETFPLGGLIPGWQKYVPGMKVGGIRLMELPPRSRLRRGRQPPRHPAERDPGVRDRSAGCEVAVQPPGAGGGFDSSKPPPAPARFSAWSGVSRRGHANATEAPPADRLLTRVQPHLVQ